ncbi:hypothetical protein GCM10010145_28060 [Streptomyces ruber]|uniref:Secreted protein n=2 Tax=Streptomyces TaxID=1883 RepID=A0A918BBU0_9ACTN|nr:hypothetical protein [Streptomyces ruber]GGQ56419.1 hypothetical protein GCM10010145_28060 [Streptomyces ruber]
MRMIKRGKALAAAAVVAAGFALPLATAGTASADTNLLPHYTSSYLECQTLGNKLAQSGELSGFNCVQQGQWVVMYPW